MGDVDHHAKAVHLSDHLSPEVGEAVVPSLVQYSVGPVVGVVPSQGHIADSQLVKLAQHSQVVFDGVAALDTQYGRALALRRQPPYVGGGAGQPYLQGILSAELQGRQRKRISAQELTAERIVSALRRRVGDIPHRFAWNASHGQSAANRNRLLDYADETFESVLDANLRCAFLTSQVLARQLAGRDAPGSIVQIASISALQGMPFGAAYSAAKAALISLTRTMALEWGPLGIRVNAVAPGTIRVPRNQAGDDPERDRAILPLGRRGAPEDIAGAALFLLSDLAQWVTGQVLAVDGGASVKPSYLDETGLPVFVTDPKVRDRLLK